VPGCGEMWMSPSMIMWGTPLCRLEGTAGILLLIKRSRN
jgi:hypothetical protein